MPPKRPALYQCGRCKAEYTRADHLTRHIRSHLQHRPFACQVCHKAFSRQDLLKRHETIHRQSRSPVTADGEAHESIDRVDQACRRCAAKKLKCTAQKPCHNCLKKQVMCENQEAVHREDDFGTAEMPEIDTVQVASLLEQPTAPIDTENPAEPSQSLIPVGLSGSTDPSFTNDEANGFGFFDNEFGADLSSIFGPESNIDADTSLNFQDADFAFLDDMDTSWLVNPASNPDKPESGDTGVAIGSAVYLQSILAGWQPQRDESGRAEQSNLALAHNETNHVRVDNWVLQDSMSVATRDRLLSMVLNTASQANNKYIVSSFPSSEILSGLIHYYFIEKRGRQINDFIHLPSFKVNKHRPELIGSVIASGAARSPSIEVRKFGYALQEAVRVAIWQRFEEDHKMFRDLEILQALYLQLDIAFFSAVNRKIELAEAISMVGVTCLRRAKQLCKSRDSNFNFAQQESQSDMEKTWSRWIELESMRRLIYFAYTLDAQISMLRNINTNLSFAEMETPLPCSPSLWHADSAVKWKTAYSVAIQASPGVMPSLSELMCRMSLVGTSSEVIDRPFADMALLGGLWTLIREHRQLSLRSSEMNYWNSFVLASRHAELSAALRKFKVEVEESRSSSPQIWILQEVLSMHLHVSIDQLHAYAGRGSKEDAYAAKNYVSRWFQDEHSREAVWHAGQVCKAAKDMAPRTMGDTYVVALFQAAVVLWVYGVMSQRRDVNPHNNPGSNRDAVQIVLDGEETTDLVKFIRHGRGDPGLMGADRVFTHVADPASLTDVVRNVITENWDREHMPQTTEETARFLQRLALTVREGPRR